MTPEWIVELFNNFAVPVVMLIVFIVGIVFLFKQYTAKDEKHDAEMKELTQNHDSEMKSLTEKYYESYTKVTESNVKVTEALNNNTKVIEKLLDKLQ